MSVSAAPTIFDVFNARQLTPRQVAESFIPPSYFANLVAPTHSLIVGPRGSGKTTLLKMLQPAALEAWGHERAAEYRTRVDFTGVFIATDINWNEQVKSLGDGRLDSDSHRQFARAAFTTEILQSLVESMMHRVGAFGPSVVAAHRRVPLNEGVEQSIAKELIASWHLDRAVQSFEGVHLALSRRMSQIRLLASQEASRGFQGRGDRIAETKFLHLDFLSAARIAVDLFNARAHEHGARWALLFDELELAPQWIRAMLIRFLRSVDDRFLFKISLSPYSVDLKRELDTVHGAGARQDFEPIRLWYVNKEQGYPFCRELLKGMLASHQLSPTEPERLFGKSAFATEREEWAGESTAYRESSAIGRQLKALERSDPSFREYLSRRKINLKNLRAITGTRRAADLRKGRSIVSLRAYFRGLEPEAEAERVQERRSRKVPSIYGGATSLFAMVEGNPRWFIAIVGELLKGASTRTITKPAQVRQVLNAAHIFRAMLKTIPCGAIGQSRRGLLSLLDPIGDYFSYAAIDAPFDPDPPSSFIVDNNTREEELHALAAC
jgi:energy-coupling factor transporter ATP-binding protein EcfA2